MPPEEIVISRHLDPDFGVLELIEMRTEASLNGEPLKPVTFREWSGKLDDLDATLSISNTDNPPKVSDEIRAAFRAVVSDGDSFKRRIARTELELAKRWSAEVNLDLRLDEETLSDLLEIEAFTMNRGRLTVWLRETGNIFGGHMVEVRIEQGAITEVCLAG